MQEAAAAPAPLRIPAPVELEGILDRGQTLTEIFRQQDVDNGDLHRLVQACDGVQDLRTLRAGQKYRLLKDVNNRLVEFRSEIDDEGYLVVERNGEGFAARRDPIPYTVQPVLLTGAIETNLVDALAETGSPDLLAIALSEVFSWDIDFATDLRSGDLFEILVERLRYEDGRVRFGRILNAVFVNNGETYRASYFDADGAGQGEYFDDRGRPLRRGFLRSPLRFKYISSGFSKSRLHPILKIRRPHLGVDYAAPTGTPVSASGDGTVVFAGRKGGFGKYVEVRHPGGYATSYGHLSRFGEGVRRGAKVRQGQVVGYVGSTGLSSGPHLDYRVNKDGRFIDPLKLKSIRKDPLEGATKERFENEVARFDLLRAGAFLVVLNNGSGTEGSGL